MTSLAGAAALLLAIPATAAAQSVRPAERATARPALASTEQHATRFWESLGDTTLARLVGAAVRANPDIAAVQSRLNGARAARTSSLLELTPSVTAVTGYSRQRMASAAFPGSASGVRLPEQDVWDAGLRMSWDVDVFGRLRNVAQARGALVAAADEDVKDVRLALASQVARAYFELRGAEDRLRVARRNADNQRGTLELTEQRLEGGRGTALDVERAKSQLSTTLSAIPGFEADVSNALDRLAVLTGQEPGAEWEMLGGEPGAVALPDSLIVGPVDAVARRRPDVRGAEQQVAASASLVQSARADYLPRLALVGGAGYTSSRFDAFGDAGTPRYTIGPQLSWPALDLARVRAGNDAARAAQAESHARYRQALLRSMEEVTTSITTYEKSRERLRHLEDAAAASERAAELARLRFTEGASDFLPVLDAERTLLEAQDRLAQGRIAASAALVGVYRATGGVGGSGGGVRR